MKRVVWLLMALLFCCCGELPAEEKWQGIDEAVVKKIAREQGREARQPLINTGEGDLQLFVFLMAGAVGGFAAGYCWRMLTEGKKKVE